MIKFAMGYSRIGVSSVTAVSEQFIYGCGGNRKKSAAPTCEME